MMFLAFLFLFYSQSNSTPNDIFIHQALKTSHLSINCAKAVSLKINELPTFEDALRDDYCSRVFLSQVAPDGFVAVLGDHNYSNQSPDYKLSELLKAKAYELPVVQSRLSFLTLLCHCTMINYSMCLTLAPRPALVSSDSVPE
jgi:hypothetical protein